MKSGKAGFIITIIVRLMHRGLGSPVDIASGRLCRGAQGHDDDVAGQLGPLIAQQWSLATALSLLVWFVFAPQCFSTLATVRRETNSWGMALLMAAYLFGLAYAASWVTYRLAVSMGGG